MTTVNVLQTWQTRILGILAFCLFCSIAIGQSFPGNAPIGGVIFEGKVSEKNGTWSKDQSTIYTVNWFEPDRIYDGQIDYDERIPIIAAGGITDEGLLVVSHSQSYHKGYAYLIALEPCNDCLEGMTVYRPIANIGSFDRERFWTEKNKWTNRPRTGNSNPERPCEAENDTELHITLSNVHITPTPTEIQGYIDIQTKTNTNSKVLYALSSKMKYSTQVFGDNAITNQGLEIKPSDPLLEQDYTTSATDFTFEEASFSMTKDQNATNVLIINTFYQSTVRLTFTVVPDFLSQFPSDIGELFKILELNASYLCNGREIPFDRIIFDDRPIGVIFEGNITPITYSYENITFNSTTNEYTFTIFASSDEPTILKLAHLQIDFDPNAFFPFQETNGHATVSSAAGTVLGDNSNYHHTIADLDASGVLLVVEANDVPVPDNLEIIDDTPRALCTVTFTMDDCTLNPDLRFRDFEMQQFSLYYETATFPMPLVYDPVFAFDVEDTPGCNCDDAPKINSWTPEEIVAGDNQVLTIFGENFGVFQRGADPGQDGTGSSVLFKNGDYTLSGSAPEFIAAGREDFMIDGVLKWTDTEIQVKVPSTDYQQGINGPAATGRFKVRNGCNEEDIIGIFDNLKIPHSEMNYRLDDEGVAKRLGLRNDNGVNGEQDGYEFEFSPNVNGANIDIKDAFEEGVMAWCDATNIRFKIKSNEAPFGASAIAGDGRNIVIIGNLTNPDAQAALLTSIVGQLYFDIDCHGLDPQDEDGGFIMTDLDFVVDGSFAVAGTQSRAEEVFTHELGHGHLLNHAFCFGFLCSDPIMHPQGAATIKDVDEVGGNEIFNDSETIINNGCEIGGSSVTPMQIETGNCGVIVAADEVSLLQYKLFPNPTNGILFIPEIIKGTQFTLTNSAGQTLKSDKVLTESLQINISSYPSGTYFLTLSDDQKIGHFKTIKL